MGKSKLKVALAAEKGIDFKKLKEKKKHKERTKKRQEREIKNGGAPKLDAADENDSDWEGVNEEDEVEVEGGTSILDDEAEEVDDDEDEEEDEEGEGPIDFAAVDESDDSDSSIDLEEKIERPRKSALKAKNAKPNGDKKKPTDEDEEEDEEDIPMSDLEDLPDEEKDDLVPHSRLTINNTSALLASLKRISIPTDKSVPFATHQSVVGVEPTADGIEDIQDDLKRELAFYAQSLDAAKRARALLKAEGVPFSRPTDYFAEMVKDDGHMEKVKAKLVEEASAKKASAEARKQRDLKKFGKQVQVAKLQERQKAKRETLEKIKTLKRKRQESSGDLGATEADLFDVGVDAELSAHNAKRAFSRGKDGERSGPSSSATRGGPNNKRQKKNEKYGFGGKKRHAKSGDAVSSGDLSSFSARGMKSGFGARGGRGGRGGKSAPRLGKSRRNAGAGKR
ncbi:Ebp2-domain-containing protein [Annulohypoxylon truncatum]|uniref:Ebp2-domain-containing protein n=1 Tax=Annulohypoxylon truncatum TaxID=327061 RepID=UPI002008B903|nr:Ebp2-domain-containing protein [Annulohypoxylon truncatum]KAI1214604.1 Ebp2-domain-containing protein [Annulohypoxylon truncatum]